MRTEIFSWLIYISTLTVARENKLVAGKYNYIKIREMYNKEKGESLLSEETKYFSKHEASNLFNNLKWYLTGKYWIGSGSYKSKYIFFYFNFNFFLILLVTTTRIIETNNSSLRCCVFNLSQWFYTIVQRHQTMIVHHCNNDIKQRFLKAFSKYI